MNIFGRYVAAFVFPSARCVKRSTETRNECYCRSKCVSTSMSAKLKNTSRTMLSNTIWPSAENVVLDFISNMVAVIADMRQNS
uniref:Uncharacterized protein n=1 Tax=Glossina pallidipes TaxID=7398 RepID=A0A1B0AD40_GLOPL